MNNCSLRNRLLTVFLCLILITSFGVECFAIDNVDVTDGESVIVNIEQVASPSYSYTFNDGHEAVMHMGFVTSDNYSLGQARLNARGNISWVYCMEFYVQAYSANTRVAATAVKSRDTIWKGLSTERQQGIELALLYGYPNSLNGATAADSFAATQALIWEFQTGVRTSTTKNTRSAVTYTYRTSSSTTSTIALSENYFYNIVAKTSGGITAYNNLVSSIYSHKLKPNFGLDSDSIPLTYDNELGVYTTTLTDSNNILSSYDVSLATDDSATVTTSGNTITISSPNRITDTTLLLKKKNVATEGQSLMVLTSAEYGQAMITGSDQVPVSFEYYVYSDNDGGRIVVKKTDAETGTFLQGAVFGVYDSTGKLVLSKTSDENGIVSFNNLDMGTYTVKELIAPSGYNLYTKKINSISLKTAGSSKTITIKDSPLKLYISVYKQGEVLTGFDSETLSDGSILYTPVYETQYLDGCVVEVYAAEDIYGPDGTFHYAKDELVDTVVTSSSGAVNTVSFYPGNYYLREVDAPDGYVISSGEKYVTLTDEPGSVTFFDLRQRCDLNFKKTLSYTTTSAMSEYYKYVSFGVYNSVAIKDLPADSLLEVIKPDEYGDCVMSVELPYGYDYYIKEITTADDFLIDENSYPFSFTGLGDNESTKIVEINSNNEIINEMKPSVIERNIVETLTDDPSPEPMLLGLLVALEGAGLAWFIFEKKKFTLN